MLSASIGINRNPPIIGEFEKVKVGQSLNDLHHMLIHFKSDQSCTKALFQGKLRMTDIVEWLSSFSA